MTFPDLFFPRRCLSCGKTGQYFCSSCLQLMIEPPGVNQQRLLICPQCFKRSILGSTHARCLKPLSLDGLVSVFLYKEMIKKAIKKLKYKLVTDLAEELISLTIRMIREKQGKFFPKFDLDWVLVPVPLHSRRERWRGFNQAEILGEMLAEKMNWRFCHDLLIRHQLTKPQVEIKDRDKRCANVRGAFKINPDSEFIIHNSKFILFDDVWTTGSTVKECAQVLKRKKADKVWGLTLAR